MSATGPCNLSSLIEKEEKYVDSALRKIWRRKFKKKKARSISEKANETKNHRRRKIERTDEVKAQLTARKENIERKCGQYRRSNCTNHLEQYYNEEDDSLISTTEILLAEDLGIENGTMYHRLLEIIQGGEIKPEDYDLLLQLDNHNEKKTMNEDIVNNLPVIVRGEDIDNLSLSGCEICLEPWNEILEGTELRSLPCDHVFCKSCIDHWLNNFSDKCPNLSCYWKSTKQ
eukprot:CAMPEP_0194199746 /NCGR_PEP_ID=MMETSP0156-20130528/644_1 /TAXON_ID=33649 /ORGANISM="Thalassionema nitzschioides, Strain L26-B" /LENGTH=229 /DNA_ID=CAMNT_0038924681 /DNA_START=83 /DNA_END=772 /DNA_ORIENTATION=+